MASAWAKSILSFKKARSVNSPGWASRRPGRRIWWVAGLISAAAAKQIGALVRTIQTDTHDAVAAMEKSTRGVVEGARLSDAAGAALSDISQVSNRLAELIQGISFATGLQATSANGVALNIQHILAVTEQTQDGTQQTAQSIHKLSVLAQELKNSVSRFRVVA